MFDLILLSIHPEQHKRALSLDHHPDERSRKKVEDPRNPLEPEGNVLLRLDHELDPTPGGELYNKNPHHKIPNKFVELLKIGGRTPRGVRDFYKKAQKLNTLNLEKSAIPKISKREASYG